MDQQNEIMCDSNVSLKNLTNSRCPLRTLKQRIKYT